MRRAVAALLAALLVLSGLALGPAAPAGAQEAGPGVVATTVTSNSTGQPAGVLITPREVVIGEPITISGTGWFLQSGEGGSAGPVFINQPSGG
ncbi:MAG: hypothetical protein AB7L84_15565, partial [Acidimicrobiia bacterium]